MARPRKRQKLDKTVLPNLPQEVWCIIYSYLPKESRKNATNTCKLWFEIIRGDSRFSGNITIPWIELQNSSFDWDNWPSLKTLVIAESSFSSPKMALEAMRSMDFKKCQSLEKVTFGVNFDVAELSEEIISTTTNTSTTQISTVTIGEHTITETEEISTTRKSIRKFMKDMGTVLALVFNPKSDIECFKLEHLDKLEIHMRCLDETHCNMSLSLQNSDNIKRSLKVMKMIGNAAKNIRWLIVGGQSFQHSEFFETGFKNFGTSLKVFTLKNDSFYYQQICEEDYVNSFHMFFKTLNESCPNLSSLNLGSTFELGSCDSTREFKQFTMAGFEMVKELNVDFRSICEDELGNAPFDWFFGLINNYNKIETLSLNGLDYPFFGEDHCFDMGDIGRKFKNLKKFHISFSEGFERVFEWGDGKSCKEYAAELAEDLDDTFPKRSIECKVLIRTSKEGDEEGKCFQILKMPFKDSVITKLE